MKWKNKMQLRLYNSLSRKVEDFKPIKAGEVGLYTCGPTVYDYAQIGNLRTYIFDDILRRTLKSAGQNVTHVMNITDVDDKTINRSHEKYPTDEPLIALKKLTSEYEKIFYDDAAKVGINLSDSRIVKATDHISDMQELIRRIPTKYIGDDSIYFDIGKYKDYGVLVKLNPIQSLHRINNDEYDKEHVADFALWKAKAEGEPSWAFKIDGQSIEGRPGWHIECSAMSVKYLGQPFDIHTGGVDLMFPHHENEIAQSRSATGKPLANYFIHGEHLLVDGQRMGKSQGNFYTLNDIIKKGYDPLALRLLFLQAHYRSQMNFTWDALDGAQAFLNRLRAWADLKFQPHLGHKNVAGRAYPPSLDKIKQALNDDLNTSQALAVLSSLANSAEQEGVNPEKLTTFLEQIDKLLGLGLLNRIDISNEARTIIVAREEARKNGKWAKADELRHELSKQGLEINDTVHGPVWSRKN